MPAAMLAPLLTLALLPLALAACPCPPAPAAAEVCGSDHKTYPSACDLDCTAPPGVAAAHPGPCRPADAALGRPTNATLLLSGRRARRSATEERWKFSTCRRRQCSNVTCSECGVGDWRCNEMCVRHCWCGCLGLQTSGLDYGRYRECSDEMDFWGQAEACMKHCSAWEGESRCYLDLHRGWCECAQQAEGTTPRPAGTHSPANTTGPADRAAAPHPGPSRPADAALGRPTNVTLLLSGRRTRRSTTEEMQRFEACRRERECWLDTCSECAVDNGRCAPICQLNCGCGCLGLQTSGRDWDRYDECLGHRDIMDQYEACTRGCSTQECRGTCSLDSMRLQCECVRQAEGTTPAGSNPANTTGPADPAAAVAHPGQSHITNATVLKYAQCKREHQCGKVSSCQCTEEDPYCWEMSCYRACACGCLGRQTGGVVVDRLDRCRYGSRAGLRCEAEHDACRQRCTTDECKDWCWVLHKEGCTCECLYPDASGGSGVRPDSSAGSGVRPAATAALWGLALTACAYSTVRNV